jgi:signal transduction histidine kinase
MNRIEPELQKPSYEELIQQNQALLRELAQIKAEKKAIWMMLAGTNRRLQMSSAAIKAAVSSMLNYDIFWDKANEHEFLETINTSVDQAGKLVKLLTLAYRLEADTLELKREPHVLQEIISVVQDHLAASLPTLVFGITLPQEGQPVSVDYEFLMTALEYLLEVIERMGVHRVGIQAVEEPSRWLLQFEGLEASTIQMILSVYQHQLDPASILNAISPENLLRLHIALQILQMQEIQVEDPNLSNHPPKLRLVVPIHS